MVASRVLFIGGETCLLPRSICRHQASGCITNGLKCLTVFAPSTAAEILGDARYRPTYGETWELGVLPGRADGTCLEASRAGNVHAATRVAHRARRGREGAVRGGMSAQVSYVS